MGERARGKGVAPAVDEAEEVAHRGVGHGWVVVEERKVDAGGDDGGGDEDGAAVGEGLVAATVAADDVADELERAEAVEGLWPVDSARGDVGIERVGEGKRSTRG